MAFALLHRLNHKERCSILEATMKPSGMSEGPMNREQGVEKLREMIKDLPLCMLTTRDESGSLHSRPMAASEAGDFDGDLWFFTYASSHKTSEINGDRQVNASFADVRHQNYVSMSGIAEVVRDRDEIKRRWKPQFKAWFPKGLEEPDIALLKVTVEKAAYWDAPAGLIPYAIALFQTQVLKQQPNVGETRTVQVQ
jgi:general stress protein 26